MNLENIAGEAIIPQHIWSTVSDPASYTDANPVGTGPYIAGQLHQPGLHDGAPTRTTGQPVPVKKVYFPAYTTNTAARTPCSPARSTGPVTSSRACKTNFIDKDPSQHIGWENPGATNVLIPNMTTWPTNQLAVRQAISAAIDRTAIGTQGEDGQEAPVTSASGLTTPIVQPRGLGSGSQATENLTADPATAASILTKAGVQEGQRRLLRPQRQGSRAEDRGPGRLHRLRPGRPDHRL